MRLLLLYILLICVNLPQSVVQGAVKSQRDLLNFPVAVVSARAAVSADFAQS